MHVTSMTEEKHQAIHGTNAREQAIQKKENKMETKLVRYQLTKRNKPQHPTKDQAAEILLQIKYIARP